MCSMMSFNVDHSETFPTEEETTKIPAIIVYFPSDNESYMLQFDIL